MRRGIHALGIAIFAITLTVLPVGLHVAHAGFWENFIDWNGLAAQIGTWVLSLFHQAVRLTAWLLNGAIQIGIVQMSSFVESLTAIDLVWRTLRDATNVFFIFILLWAAIQTILNVATFQTKEVITRLVIIALLVNFSLFLTKAVIDVSNIISLQFYNAMNICEWDDAANKCKEGSEVGIADVFMDKLRLTTIYNPDSERGRLTETNQLEPANIGTITFIGSIFFLITAFIFLAAAILFIIRFGLLIFLMVIAPAAFAMAILPNTRRRFEQWLSALLNQAFFAPAYLALVYVTLRIISDQSFKETLYGGTVADGILGLVDGPLNVILAFALVTMFLVAALMLAKQMGTMGSETMMAWGKTARDWGLGKMKGGAKRVGMIPVRSAQTLGRETRSAMVGVRANLAQRALKRDGVGGWAARTVLGGTMAADRYRREGLNEIDEAKKKYGATGSVALQRMLKSPLMAGNRRDRAAITQILADRGDLDLKKIEDPEIIRTARETIARKAGDTKKIDQTRWMYAKDATERAEAIRGDRSKKLAPIAADQVEKLDENDYFVNNHPDVQLAMYQTFTSSHINNLNQRTDGAPDAFFAKMLSDLQAAKNSTSITDLVQWIGDSQGPIKNKKLASWMRTLDGQATLQAHGFTSGPQSPTPGHRPVNPNVGTNPPGGGGRGGGGGFGGGRRGPGPTTPPNRINRNFPPGRGGRGPGGYGRGGNPTPPPTP